MSPKNRALLIASPYGGLPGPENDVELMAEVLTKYEFEITKCCAHNATRDQILSAWQQLISESSPEDAVVIYYSGHGGLIESSQTTSDQQGESETSLRSQFLVPMDFDQTTDEDFRGILNIELSYMLKDMTNKTENVTIIQDCCHAGRMACDPHHNNEAWPRNLPETKHQGVLLRHVERLRREGRLTGDSFLKGNPHAVHIAAAATSETAWSYEGLQGQPIGVLTEALATAMDKAIGQRLSWRTLLLGVCEAVNREFPQQHPRAEGPETRILFSKKHMTSGALLMKLEDGDVILQGGRVAGVHEGSVYDIMPFGFERADKETRVAEVRVKYVNGFKAMAEIVCGRIPTDGALAFLRKEALPKLFVSFPDDLPTLGVRLGQSKFLRCGDPGEKQALLEVKKEGQRIEVRKGEMVLASYQFTDATMQTAIDNVVSDGERLARGHHLLTLGSGEEDENLNHSVGIEFGRVDNGTCVETYAHDGTAGVTENQKVCIKLHNGGNSTLFVSVFDVNVAGAITLVSSSWPRGIKLESGEDYILGKAQFGNGIKGLGLSWPRTVPKVERVEETLVFILSSEEVSLQHLADPKRSIEAKGRISHLERITYHLASGQARDLEPEPRGLSVRYAVHHIPFSLRTQPSDDDGFKKLREAEMAVSATPKDHPNQPERLDSLVILAADQNKWAGSPGDLQAAISKTEEAVAATPLNSSDQAKYPNNLGGMLSDRYRRMEDAEDIDAAISKADTLTSMNNVAQVLDKQGKYEDNNSGVRQAAVESLVSQAALPFDSIDPHVKPSSLDLPKNSSKKHSSRNSRRPSAQNHHNAEQIRKSCKFVFRRSPATAMQDFCKKTVEDLAGEKLSWWPLSDPEEELKPGFTRVYSQPLTGSLYKDRSFYDDVPTILAEKLFPRLAAARSAASGIHWDVLRHEAVVLEGTTLMRLLRDENSQGHVSDDYELSARNSLAIKDGSAGNEHATISRPMVKSEQSSVGIDRSDAGMAEIGAESANAASKKDRNKNSKDDQDAKPPSSDKSENQSDEEKPVLFLSLDIVLNDSRACSVDVGLNDHETMKNLQKSYNTLRNSFFWNQKRPVGIKFYQFRSFLYKPERRHHIELYRDRERYPHEDDKDYKWKLGYDCQEGDHHYPNGEAWYFFSRPGDCGNSTALRDMLPKRRRDKAGTGEMYGLYIEQRHSVWQIVIPIVVVLVLTLSGTLWFIVPWLKDHPDDLQGATVPVFLALTVIQFILTLLTTLVVFRWSL